MTRPGRTEAPEEAATRRARQVRGAEVMAEESHRTARSEPEEERERERESAAGGDATSANESVMMQAR